MGTTLLLAADEPQQATFVLRLDGLSAAQGSVEVEELSKALDGLKTFLNASTELHFSGGDPARRVPSGSPLRIEIKPPTKGSWEAVITAVVTYAGMRIVDGALGNRGDAVLVWSYKQLSNWFRKTFKAHLDAKSSNVDKAEIVRRLQQMVVDENPPLASSVAQQPLLVDAEVSDSEDASKETDDEEETGRESFVQKIVEQIDLGLYDLTEPVGASCESLAFEDEKKIRLFSITPIERDILRRPLLPAQPSDDWIAAKIKFIRINKETGSCIFEFLDTNERTGHCRGRIIDRRLQHPRDLDTQSFSLEQPLDLWFRQRIKENGGKYFELSQEVPNKQMTLFGAASL
jgi:hypothetical protein